MSITTYGIVKITRGKFKGRIGYYDDDEYDRGKEQAIVYFGSALLGASYHLIPKSYISNRISITDLFNRQQSIYQEINDAVSIGGHKEQSSLLQEFILIETYASEMHIRTRFFQRTTGKGVFICHSSLDKYLAKCLATDLMEAGHRPWLDEWIIKVGESIPKEISKGLDSCDFLIIVLSSNSVESNWVEHEWHSKYWDEVSTGKVKVLPVLIEDCKIPTLLKHKKYADFRYNYAKGLEEVLDAICD